MKIFVQRVSGLTSIESQLSPQQKKSAQFKGSGLVVLLGWTQFDAARTDLAAAEEWLFTRALGLRIFPDSNDRMNLSLADYLKEHKSEGGILWVPQFTLAGKLDSGFRPSFTDAMAPDLARVRFLEWVKKTEAIQNQNSINHIFGDFGADMNLSFTNWGPLSLHLEK